MSGRGTATRPLSLALLGISNSSLRPKPRALSHHRSAGRAQFLLNRFQPVPESAIYGTDFFWRNSSRGDVGQYSALKHGDLVQRHLLDLSYPRLNIGIYFRRSPVAHAFLPWWHDLDPEPQRQRNKAPAPPGCEVARMDYAAVVLVFPDRMTLALLAGFVVTVSAAAARLAKLSTDAVRISC
jgi:hypothetical protein